jgi:hypothetical protein
MENLWAADTTALSWDREGKHLVGRRIWDIKHGTRGTVWATLVTSGVPLQGGRSYATRHHHIIIVPNHTKAACHEAAEMNDLAKHSSILHVLTPSPRLHAGPE